MKSTIVLFLFVSICDGVKLPENFNKCNRKKPDLKDCVLKAARHGVSQLVRPHKEVNLPSIDPFEVPLIRVTAGTGSYAVDQKFINVKFYGLDKVKVDRFEFDLDKKTLVFSGSFPEIRLESQYNLVGKILVVPVDSEGNSTLSLKNAETTCLLTYEEVPKKGKTYLKFLSVKIDMEISSASFYFDNLFPGNKELSDSTNKALNDNWKEIFDESKNVYFDIISQIVIDLLNKFFSKVSLEEAFD